MSKVIRRTSVPVSEAGTLDLPEDMRRALGLEGADRVVLTQDADGIRITSIHRDLELVRALARPFRRDGVLASEELIAERRAEVAREDGEAEGPADGRRGP